MRRLLSLAAAILLAACSGSSAASATRDVRVQPGRAEYDRGNIGVARVGFTVANHTADRISVQQCGGGVTAELQRLEGGAWRTESGDACLAVYAPLGVAPGATAEGDLSVAGPGTYRLRVTYGAPGYQVVRHGVSPSFGVR